MINHILFIGAVNQYSSPKGGEEYKNKIFLQFLKRYYHIQLLDTYNWKKRPGLLFKLFLNLFFKDFDRVIISASSYSVFRLLKYIRFFSSISRKISYFVIGGYFPDGIKEGKYKLNYYKNLHSIVVEGDMLKNNLFLQGLKENIFVVPNFKDFVHNKPEKEQSNNFVKFVFISRIHAQKGIYEIIDASRKLLEWKIFDFNITFFGPLELDSNEPFLSQLNDKLIYGGYLDFLNDPSTAYKNLASYDVMLFPTYWKGEGFPGVLVDAFVAGLPVIASDWNMNREIIKDGYNGLIIQPNSSDDLALAMKKLYDNRNLMNELGSNAYSSALNYHIDTVGLNIVNIIENNA